MNIAPTVSNSIVRQRARSTLLAYFDALGRPPVGDFFPVKLEGIVDLVLRWSINGEAAYLGYTRDGDTIVANCDYESQRISLLPPDLLDGAERRFALAHEIGHVVLHQNHPLCSGGSSIKKRSLRARRYYKDPIFERMEREAQVFSSELLMPGKSVKEHFMRLFDRERLRAESSYATTIWGESGLPPKRESRINVADVALAASTYTSNDSKSLTDFFGVSREAMKIRLVELELIF